MALCPRYPAARDRGQPTLHSYQCKADPGGGPDWLFLFGLDSERHWPPTADAVGLGLGRVVALHYCSSTS